MAQIASIADDQRRPAGQIDRDVARPAAPDHEGNAAPAEGPLDLLESLEHERVVAPVGLRIVVHQTETDHHRQLLRVGLADGVLEGRIERRSL